MQNTHAQHSCQDLLDFIDASPSPWHVVATIEKKLQAFQFQRLFEHESWCLSKGGRYFVVRDDSSIVLFVIGSHSLAETGFKILGAHTDSPGFRLKPKPELKSENLHSLALEVYGGPILASFTDRDLSLAGRVAFQADNGAVASVLVQFSDSLLRLPNLAIHLNRAVNEDGLKLHKQTDLAAIYAHSMKEQLPEHQFYGRLAQAAGVDSQRILSWDLAVYDTQKGSFWGEDQLFYANSQLDNLASCHAGLSAFLQEDVLSSKSTLLCAFFDHEEIGSESAKGAGGSFLADVLQRIAYAVDASQEDYQRALASSFMISADMAHAYHPNHASVYEPNHKVLVNQGPVIKINSNQRYASDSQSVAQFSLYCQQAEVPFQIYAHRGDLPCGSTIGPIASAKLGIPTVDVGCPMWAMHSVRESAGVLDHGYMIKALHAFFRS